VITRVHHVQITVPKGSEDAARSFYCGLLGLKEIEKPAALIPRGGLWLTLGELQIHVGVENGVDRRATKAHVAYEVSDLTDLGTRLRAAGIAIEPCPGVPGYERLEFRDPFGNRVEMLARAD
jgi:catechol 2,3-dioxygenase-like lactoylglutathione lyase family enzyme